MFFMKEGCVQMNSILKPALGRAAMIIVVGAVGLVAWGGSCWSLQHQGNCGDYHEVYGNNCSRWDGDLWVACPNGHSKTITPSSINTCVAASGAGKTVCTPSGTLVYAQEQKYCCCWDCDQPGGPCAVCPDGDPTNGQACLSAVLSGSNCF